MAKEGIFRVEYMPGENFRDYDLLFIEREEFDTLEEAREEARRRLGDLDDWRRSPPRFEWNDPHGPTYEFVEMYRCGRGRGSNFVMISRRELRAVPPKLRERVIEGPIEEGTLQLQPSGRWAVCRPGRRPVEIMTDELFRVEVGGELKLTRMEFRHFTGPLKGREYSGPPGEYYSADGYPLANGLRAAIGAF